jgi:hypothetical protein
MAMYPTFLEQFRAFYFQNKPHSMEDAIEYFSVFGGMGWDVDMSKPLNKLIENKVLKNYKYINADFTKVTKSDKATHSLLSALALGDRREHSACKRSRIKKDDGKKIFDELYDIEFLNSEFSVEAAPSEEKKSDDKLDFAVPFHRFWFAFVSPYFKSIKDGNYDEFKEKFANNKSEFINLTFQKLCFEVMKQSLDESYDIGSYWDRDVEIDILAKNESGKLIAGSFKNSNAKASKSDLTKLKEKCIQAELDADLFVIFSKSGFSNELKNEKGENLKLFSTKHFKMLVENLTKKDYIECVSKRY